MIVWVITEDSQNQKKQNTNNMKQFILKMVLWLSFKFGNKKKK